PFEDMDEGVMELISGNRDYWFESKRGGLGLSNTMGQNLNILVCILAGRPVPDYESGSDLAAAMLRFEQVSAAARPIAPPDFDDE
ncbi:MAG: hypothetical protein ACI9U2_001977, partial [Bradymonadia bacterium]